MTIQPKWMNDPELKDLAGVFSARESTMFTQDLADGDNWVTGDDERTKSTSAQISDRVLEFQADDLAQAIRQYVGYALLERDSRNRIVDRGQDDPRNAPKWRRLHPIVDAMVTAFSSNGADESQGLLCALEVARRLAPGARVENMLATLYCNTGRFEQGIVHAREAVKATSTPYLKAMAWTWLAVGQRGANVECPVSSAREAVKLAPDFLFSWIELLRSGCHEQDIQAIEDAVESMRSHPQMCSSEAHDTPDTPPDVSHLPPEIQNAIPEGLWRYVSSNDSEGGQA